MKVVPMRASFGLAAFVRSIAPTMSPLPIGVATAPGCTELTRMPCLPSSAAKALVMPVTACLLVV